MSSAWRARAAGPLKLAVGVALIAWLLSVGVIPAAQVGAALTDLPSLALNAAALALIVLCLGLRWQRLSGAVGVHVPLPRYFAMTMVSGFFGMLGVGSVGGDAVRAWYLAGESDGKKAAVIVVADRIVSGAVSLVLAALLWHLIPMGGDARLEAAGIALTLAALGATGVAALVFYLPLPKAVLRSRWAVDIENARLAYRGRGADLAFAAVCTAASLAVTVVLYWAQSKRLGIAVPLDVYAKLVPATLMASYLSFVPFGLGVGQLALWALFAWSGVAKPDQAGALVTVLQTYAILLHAAVGFPALLMLRRRASAR